MYVCVFLSTEWCTNQFRWCCCHVFLPLFILITLFSGAIALGAFFLLQQEARDPVAQISSQQSPGMVTGSSDVLVKLDADLTFVSTVSISSNCSGGVYYRRSPYCDNLVESTTEVPLPQSPRTVRYLNNGSSVDIGYGYTPHAFLIIHSLEGYGKYLEILKEGKCKAKNIDLVKCICNLIDGSSGYDDFYCYNQTRKYQHFNIVFEKADFYFTYIPYPVPSFQKTLYMVQYNRSEFVAQGFSHTPLQFNQYMQKYQASVPLPGRWIHERYDCMILSTDCPSSTDLYQVKYNFQYDVHFYYWIYIVPGVYIVTLVSGIAAQVCCYRRKRIRPRNSSSC